MKTGPTELVIMQNKMQKHMESVPSVYILPAIIIILSFLLHSVFFFEAQRILLNVAGTMVMQYAVRYQ